MKGVTVGSQLTANVKETLSPSLRATGSVDVRLTWMICRGSASRQ